MSPRWRSGLSPERRRSQPLTGVAEQPKKLMEAQAQPVEDIPSADATAQSVAGSGTPQPPGGIPGGITMKQLLEAGVHFGHQTKRWNPKMKPYIFGARNGIYIIDLQQTVTLSRAAYASSPTSPPAAASVLFVGTKKQAQDVIARGGAALRPVLRHQPLAGRHAHQLPHHQAGHRPAADAREDDRGRHLRPPAQEGSRLAAAASRRSWRSTSAASRT